MSILYFKRVLLPFQICIRDKVSGAMVLIIIIIIHALRNNNQIIKHVVLKHIIHDKYSIIFAIYISLNRELFQFFFDQ